MKKKYIVPQTKTLKVSAQPLMSLSASFNSGESITNSDDFGVREESDLFDNNYAFDF